MRKGKRGKFIGFMTICLSTFFVSSCATGFRDAALAGLFDFTCETVIDALGLLVSLSD